MTTAFVLLHADLAENALGKSWGEKSEFIPSGVSLSRILKEKKFRRKDKWKHSHAWENSRICFDKKFILPVGKERYIAGSSEHL